ncbi:MAG: hypothetical protein L6R38_000672 [Xanthoria sp. 2 TBL-2021]|nr:MAG: hypothetical protein L6R38_000672 [Xanthoria sp. 2 TBL-2021]
MAPRKPSPKVTITAENSASEDDANGTTMDDPRGSQGADDQIVKNMAKALKESTRRRRKARRGKIGQDYHLEIGQLEASVTANLNDISNQASKLQRTRLETLRVLLEKRALVETDILQSITRLDKAFANANQELQTVLATRMENYNNVKPG